MKKVLLTLLIVMLFQNSSPANHHFPISRDSKAAVEQGKLLYIRIALLAIKQTCQVPKTGI